MNKFKKITSTILTSVITLNIGVSCLNFNVVADETTDEQGIIEGTEFNVEGNEETTNLSFLLTDANYNEEKKSIDIEWLSNPESESYNVLASVDNENFDILATVKNANEYQYQIKEDFDTKYFKITFEDENGKLIESMPFSVIKTDNGYEISVDDMDEDGFPDDYEKVYGTDPENPDTDGDKLTDGFEVLKSHTNPTMVDTDNNGTTDDLEDLDEDNIDNYNEMILGTNPYSSDTDEDDLQDNDEVNKYNTDPLNPDTDGDGISDFDEIELGLNPNDPSDNETVVHQVINAEDLTINEYNEDFSISMDIEASNNVKQFLTQKSSPYSSILLKNKAIIGLPIYLEYQAGTIYSGTIKFKLGDKLVNETQSYYPELNIGIERYGLFIYNEEMDVIVPVSCKYDIDDKSFTVDASTKGNLMVVDYEALLYDMGITSDKVQETIKLYNASSEGIENSEEKVSEEIENSNEISECKEEILTDDDAILNETKPVSLLQASAIIPIPVNKTEKDNEAPDEIELIFVADRSLAMNPHRLIKNMRALITKLSDSGITAHTAIITFSDVTVWPYCFYGLENRSTLNGHYPTDDSHVSIEGIEQFYSDKETIDNLIDTMPWYGHTGDAINTPIEGLGMATLLNHYTDCPKFLFMITDSTYRNDNYFGYSNMADVAMKLREEEIQVGVVTESWFLDDYDDLAYITDGIKIPVKFNETNYYTFMYDFIVGNDTDGDGYLDCVDDDPYKAKAYVIDDAYIDDTDLKKKGRTLRYARHPNRVHTFSLTPKKDSYYVFVNWAEKAPKITVSHEEGALFWKKTVNDKSTKDGNYLLKKGKEYTIEVSGGDSNYYFMARQDNWAYVPDGKGMEWTYDDTNNGLLSDFSHRFGVAPEKQIYISRELLLEATKRKEDGVEYYECHSMEDVDKVMKNIQYIDVNSKETMLTEIENIIEFGGGAILLVVGFVAVPEGFAVMVIDGVGGAFSVKGLYGNLEWLEKHAELKQFKEAISEGNFSVIYTKSKCYVTGRSHLGFSSSIKNWEAWTTVPYFYKFKNGCVGKITNIDVETVKSYIPSPT